MSMEECVVLPSNSKDCVVSSLTDPIPIALHYSVTLFFISLVLCMSEENIHSQWCSCLCYL